MKNLREFFESAVLKTVVSVFVITLVLVGSTCGLFLAIDSIINRDRPRSGPDTVATMERSETLEDLDTIPEVKGQWNELKAIVEAPKSSESGSEENECIEGDEETEEAEEIVEDVELEEAKVSEVTETESEPEPELSNQAAVEVAPKKTHNVPAEVAGSTTIYFDVPLSEDLQRYIFGQCETIGLEPDIVVAMINRESKFDSGVIGDRGKAFGLMQIHPEWHSGRMEELGCTDLLNPYDNVTVGIDIIAELMRSGESIEWVLMAYNGGARYADRLIAEGRVSDYAVDVLEYKDDLNTYTKVVYQ